MHHLSLSCHFLGQLQLRTKVRQSKNQELACLDGARNQRSPIVGEHLSPKKAWQGVSLNAMTIRHPSQLIWSNSCPLGLGELHLSGWAWHFPAPPESPLFGEDTANDLLKFVAMVANIWLLMLELDSLGAMEECVLALGDSASAIGWLFKSGKLPAQSLHFEAVQFAARKLAQLTLESSHCLASQHLQEEHNVAPNLLLFAECHRGEPHPLASDFPSDKVLTQCFHAHAPQLIPLQVAELSWSQSKKKLTKTGTELGDVGLASVGKLVSLKTCSSEASSMVKESLPFDPSFPSTVLLIGTSSKPVQHSVRNLWWR